MADYSVSGAFGKVKIFDTCIPSNRFSSVDHVTHIGWHDVNEKYIIDRPQGGDQHLLLLTLSGEGRVKIGHTQYPLKAGTVAVIPKALSNRYSGIRGKNWEFYWLHYVGSHADACTADIVQNGRYVFGVGQTELSLFFGPFLKAAEKGPERELTEAEALDRILHHLRKQAFLQQYDHRQLALVDQIILFLEQNQGAEFSLDRLVAEYHYSKEHIIRLFKSATGMTPYRYWQGLRFKQASIELESGAGSIGQIALKFGYRSVSSFSKQFKEIVGVSPKEYRTLYGFHQN